MRIHKIALAVLALALLSAGCVSTESARKVKFPWYSGFIGGGGGSAFNGTLAAGVPLTLTGATSGTTAFNAAAVTTVSRTYVLPGGDGNAHAFLTTDGSGNLSWQTLDVGTGVTKTISGNTTTIASTGGGGGGGGGAAINPTTSIITIGDGISTGPNGALLIGPNDQPMAIADTASGNQGVSIITQSASTPGNGTGSILIQAGAASLGGSGGGISIQAGQDAPDAGVSSPGNVNITAGFAHATSRNSSGVLSMSSGGSSAGVTDGSSGNVLLTSGPARGAGLPGDIQIQSSFPRASGTAGQAPSDRQFFAGPPKTLPTSSGTTTSFAQIGLSYNNLAAGGKILVTVEADDGTNFDATVCEFSFVVVEKAGVFTGSVSAVSLTATQCNSGTLTLASASAISSGLLLQITPTWTTIVPTRVRISWQVLGNGGITVSPV